MPHTRYVDIVTLNFDPVTVRLISTRDNFSSKSSDLTAGRLTTVVVR